MIINSLKLWGDLESGEGLKNSGWEGESNFLLILLPVSFFFIFQES